MAAAHEFLLLHRLYRSHRTAEVADPAFASIHFPPRWHYDFLRALDYFRWVDAPRDERMTDAIELLNSKRLADGRWKQGQNWAGRVFFEMEPVGQPGRWNTLRGVRVLRWWEGDVTARQHILLLAEQGVRSLASRYNVLPMNRLKAIIALHHYQRLLTVMRFQLI